MPVITFANTKGGAGKTTAALLLATELARGGARVTVLDADPQAWITGWAQTGAAPRNIEVVSAVTAASIQGHLAEARRVSDYIIIDLPGARDTLLANALGFSDHVVIPIQGCAMDAKGGAQVLELLMRLEKSAGIRIPHSVLLTRVNSLVTTRALQMVKTLLAERQVRVLDTPIVERAAFRDIFDCGGLLQDMDAQRVSNLDKALENARLFAEEIRTLVPYRGARGQMRRAA
ncbi:chromosome partitioning protein ParA [Rhizobium rhizosphaerae]|uniref:Chromosome partitioning protein ParA n=1 Tax=Xaviernesmea rhizosphaerae TaxID=1672749 RepID=A0A1Q9AM72_9HYPH|nr:ParA family protein [Xaviernesmea rhizosphaerae]OLP56504.1 chromosome partitioning protein ParA [Xaviernesmea rhizosphaerae]OQP87807.1 chromosome partitioning protein ParA [Xaviernesmea rhizosphaerae]